MSTSQVKASNIHSPRQLCKEFQLFSWPLSSEILALGDLGSDSIARVRVKVNQDQEVSAIVCQAQGIQRFMSIEHLTAEWSAKFSIEYLHACLCNAVVR
jgi:hypothetical protein